jgi:FtsP/CotA-like multicopper oxidase with cupredoxin domain
MKKVRLGPAERADIVIDFKDYEGGQQALPGQQARADHRPWTERR